MCDVSGIGSSLKMFCHVGSILQHCTGSTEKLDDPQTARASVAHSTPVKTLAFTFPTRMINFKFLLQTHQKYYITQYGELGFVSLTQMKDDCTTNSHYIQLFLFRTWERKG